MKKDDAEKCATKGISEYNDGEYESAVYWFQSTQNLHETERVAELLKNAEKKIEEKKFLKNPKLGASKY